MKVEFYDIIWNTDNEKIELPEKIILTVKDNFDPSSEGAELLSNETGWLVESFSFKNGYIE